MSSVQVVVRLRPLNEKEKKHGTLPVVSASTSDKTVTVIKGKGKSQARSSYKFDNVFTAFSSQEEVFDATLKPVLRDVLHGFESTVFAYGQTGTGKTHTMEGNIDDLPNQGVIPRSAKSIFDALESKEYQKYSVKVSFLEIYNEELCDLLASKVAKLDIMGGKNGPFCRGLSQVSVNSTDEVLKLMRRAQAQRQVGETNMNKESSRSHCIFTIAIQAKRILKDKSVLEICGKLHCVDLAGSECAKSANLERGNESQTARERERKNINRSLLTLGRVVSMLKEQSSGKKKQSVRIPYRDSKLTRILQESLGGRCKTCLIATISPSVTAIEESMSTLNYAQAANGIINKPVITSFLSGNSNSMNGSALTSSSSNSEKAGAVEHWHELECRLEYMKNQVEEAQQALARKHLQQQELIEKTELALQEKEQAMLEVEQAKQENTNLKLEIQQQVLKNQALAEKLTETQTSLKERTILLTVTKNTESKLTNEAKLLLRALQQSILNSTNLHSILEEKRCDEVRQKKSTRAYQESNVGLLGSIDKALTSILVEEHGVCGSLEKASEENSKELFTFFSTHQQSLKILADQVHATAKTLQDQLEQDLVSNVANITFGTVAQKVQQAQESLTRGNGTLQNNCQTIQQHLTESTTQLQSMIQAIYQSTARDWIPSLKRQLEQSQEMMNSIIFSSQTSLAQIQEERKQSTRALQSLVHEWRASSEQHNSSVVSTVDVQSEEIVSMLKLLAKEKETTQSQLEQQLQEQHIIAMDYESQQSKSFHNHLKLLEHQKESLQVTQQQNNAFAQKLVQTVMTGLQDLLQTQMSSWGQEREKHFESFLNTHSQLTNQHEIISNKSQQFTKTLVQTNQQLQSNADRSRQTSGRAFDLFEKTNTGLGSIKELCQEQDHLSQDRLHDASKILDTAESTHVVFVEQLASSLKTQGQEYQDFVSQKIHSNLQQGVEGLSDSTNQVLEQLKANVIDSTCSSMKATIQEPAHTMVNQARQTLTQLDETAEEGKTQLKKIAVHQSQNIDFLSSNVEKSCDHWEGQLQKQNQLATDYQASFESQLHQHESRVSTKIKSTQEQTSNCQQKCDEFAHSVIGIDQEAPTMEPLLVPQYTTELTKTPDDNVILQEYYTSSIVEEEQEKTPIDKENMTSSLQPSEVEKTITINEEKEESPTMLVMDEGKEESSIVLQPTTNAQHRTAGVEPSKRRTTERRKGSRLKKPRTHI